MKPQEAACVLVPTADGDKHVPIFDMTRTWSRDNCALSWTEDGRDYGVKVDRSIVELVNGMCVEVYIAIGLNALRERHPELRFIDSPEMCRVVAYDDDKDGDIPRWMLVAMFEEGADGPTPEALDGIMQYIEWKQRP